MGVTSLKKRGKKNTKISNIWYLALGIRTCHDLFVEVKIILNKFLVTVFDHLHHGWRGFNTISTHYLSNFKTFSNT